MKLIFSFNYSLPRPAVSIWFKSISGTKENISELKLLFALLFIFCYSQKEEEGFTSNHVSSCVMCFLESSYHS